MGGSWTEKRVRLVALHPNLPGATATLSRLCQKPTGGPRRMPQLVAVATGW